MDKEVYLLCPVCKTITGGMGSGDLLDCIRCQECSNSFTARSSIKYQKYQFDEKGFVQFKGKDLYIPVEIEIC